MTKISYEELAKLLKAATEECACLRRKVAAESRACEVKEREIERLRRERAIAIETLAALKTSYAEAAARSE